MDKATSRAVKQLHSGVFLLGGRIRRKAAKTLIGTHEPEVVDHLTNALEDPNPKVRETVTMALDNLKGDAVDRLCELWEQGETRSWNRSYCDPAISPRPLFDSIY